MHTGSVNLVVGFTSPSERAPVTVTSLHVDRAPGRVADDRLLPGMAGQLAVVLQLQPAEAAVVDARVTDHLGGDAALRVLPPLLRVGEDPREVPLQEERRLRGLGEALDV